MNNYPTGTKIYNANEQEFGKIVSAQNRMCACGKVGKLKVQWPDGTHTLICPQGIRQHKDGYKIS